MTVISHLRHRSLARGSLSTDLEQPHEALPRVLDHLHLGLLLDRHGHEGRGDLLLNRGAPTTQRKDLAQGSDSVGLPYGGLPVGMVAYLQRGGSSEGGGFKAGGTHGDEG
jgi:hypothetical protein